MKTLSTLAVLTAATAAQAYTLDVNVGHSRLDNYDNVSVVGLGIGTHLNNEYHLGLNFGRKNISSAVNLVDAKATSATLDLTYNLSQGGIRPFIGAGVGALIRPVGGWLSDKWGGARVTQWDTIVMIAATIGAGYYVSLASVSRSPMPYWLAPQAKVSRKASAHSVV